MRVWWETFLKDGYDEQSKLRPLRPQLQRLL